MPDPIPTPAPEVVTVPVPTPEAGWKTSEFWLTIIAAIASALVVPGMFPAESTIVKVATIAGIVLAALGYTVARGIVKAAHAPKTIVAVPIPPALAKPSALGSSVVVPIVALGMLGLTGCACSTPEHRNDPICVIVHNIVDCTESSVVAVVPQFTPVVLSLINSATGGDGTIDWASVEMSLASLGIRDGLCILAAIESEFLKSAPRGGPRALKQAQSYRDGFEAYRAKRWPGVKAKLADGTVL